MILSKFSIKKQVLIIFAPVILCIILISYLSNQRFENFEKDIQKIADIKADKLEFIEIESQLIQLQRNSLVYSYIGYSGVLKKIEYLYEEIELKIGIINNILYRNLSLKDRWERLLANYLKYKEAFKSSVDQRTKIIDIKKNHLKPVTDNIINIMNNIIEIKKSDKKYDLAYAMLQTEKLMGEVSFNLSLYESSPDASLISNASKLIKRVEDSVDKYSSLNIKDSEEFESLKRNIAIYKKNFNQVSNLNRNYLHLTNVVLPGKASEINNLTQEINDIVEDRSLSLIESINQDIKDSNNHLLILYISLALIGVVCSLLMAISISKPVAVITDKILKLASGDLKTEIPNTDRNDEVGDIARASIEFREMANDLKNKTSELEEFAYRTSHDLRSPLLSSIGLLNVVRNNIEKDKKDSAIKGINIVETSLIKLESLVKDILAITAIKNYDESRTDINIKNLIDESVKKFSNLPNFARIKVQNLVDDKITINVKKTRITLIFENLISNSIKYQDLNKDDSFILIKTKEIDDKLLVSFEDNGIGIPQSREDQMYKMFQRFHARTAFGSGLGLYMIKKSVEIIGGEILYENIKDGTKFSVIIPRI